MEQDRYDTSATDNGGAGTALQVVPFAPEPRLAPAARASHAGGPASAAALLRALQRLESVVDEEVEALRSHQQIDFDQFSRRKSRGLLELVRSSRAMGEVKRDPVIAGEIVRLRSKLKTNHNMLQLHLDAVREVSEVISRTIREAESDGTYPPTAGRKDPR